MSGLGWEGKERLLRMKIGWVFAGGMGCRLILVGM